MLHRASEMIPLRYEYASEGGLNDGESDQSEIRERVNLMPGRGVIDAEDWK